MDLLNAFAKDTAQGEQSSRELRDLPKNKIPARQSELKVKVQNLIGTLLNRKSLSALISEIAHIHV
jgi:hypothetical protein